jgi:hypothetical protein
VAKKNAAVADELKTKPQKVKAPKARPAEKPVAPFKPRVHVRMYLQGLGDCFLLRFEPKENAFFHVLIDCGIYKASPKAGELMNQVVDDIVETTGDHGVDVLVSTHEHWDHISGFSQALVKFKALRVGETWQAWTEDPKNPLANRLRDKYEATKTKLVGLMHKARSNSGMAAIQALDDAFNVMAFFGVHNPAAGASDPDNPDGTGDPYKDIKNLMASKNPRYLSPGDVQPLGNTGVKAFVFGPPTSESVLRKQDIAAKDAYQKQQLAFFDGLEEMLGAAAASLDGDAVQDPSSHPFDGGQRISLDVAFQFEFFQTLYGSTPDHPEAFRSIDDLAFDTLGNLALRMDNYINNTSLVLAFRLPSGRVLLFPGDAQGGNWRSWADLKSPLKFETEKTDAHQLLSQTVLYKVAHHGSHNATPKTYGLELMTHPDLRALVPVDHAIAQAARYGEMPLVNIMKALEAKTHGAVFRSDGDVATVPHAIFDFAQPPKTLKIMTEKDGKAFDRPMYCETEFDLE